MISEKLLSGAVQEFLEYSHRDPERIRQKSYKIYQWTEDSQAAATRTVIVPSVGELSEEQLDELPKLSRFIEELVTDDDVPLIQTQTAATTALNRIIKEARVEGTRRRVDELQNDTDLIDALHSNEVTLEYIAPIIGLSFDEEVHLADNFSIRRLSGFEKELMLNRRAMGGGSIALERAIQAGYLTHAAVYKHTTVGESAWGRGFVAMPDADQRNLNALEDLRIALRLLYSEEFQIGIRHTVDRTFYPSITSSHEPHRLSAFRGVVEPEVLSNVEQIAEYYQLVSNTNDDEGLRVATDRLESSHRGISSADNVVDAVIGIEALLSSEHSGSFQEVRRRAAVLSGEKATYSELGRLQNLRNTTVHGQKAQVDRDDVEQARDLLSVLIDRVTRITIKNGIRRDEVIDVLDEAIDDTIERRFDELLSEMGPQ